MKSLDLFMPYVQPYVMGCPDSAVRQAIVDAAIEFCDRTHVVQQTLDPMTTELAVSEYELDLPSRQELVQVKRAWFKGSELEPVAIESVRNALAWRDVIPGVQAVSGDPREFYTVDRGAVGLYPRPTKTEVDTLTVRAALKPSRTATVLEDQLYEDWVEVIAAGALKRLHATRGQPYTDLPAASAASAVFLEGCNRAKYVATYGRTRGELRVQMRPLA